MDAASTSTADTDTATARNSSAQNALSKVTAAVARTTGDSWARLVADPSHTPELLAITAVQILGPRARTWAERTREDYPTATPEALARLATRQFTRFGTLTSLFSALAGSYAPVALVGSAALTDAELALHLAAAYGLDPTDPQRAADLLVIIGVHDSVEEAEAALAVAGRPAYETAGGGERRNVVRLARLFAAQTAPWAVGRVLSRRFPGTSLLAAVLSGRVTADATAVRATAHFKRQLQPPASGVRSS